CPSRTTSIIPSCLTEILRLSSDCFLDDREQSPPSLGPARLAGLFVCRYPGTAVLAGGQRRRPLSCLTLSGLEGSSSSTTMQRKRAAPEIPARLSSGGERGVWEDLLTARHPT